MPTDAQFHCNSFHSCQLCNYCRQCSHSSFLGSGCDETGHLWRWDFSPQFGPLFLRKDGEPLAHQPEGADHPAWGAFEKWLEEWKKETAI